MSADETHENIILQIENCSLTFNKHALISNSDYFKAMFENDFVEKSLKVIPLQGVDLKAMTLIHKSQSNEDYEDQDILIVLQTACMLQFRGIIEHCLRRITELLSPKTSLEIWLVTEQLDIRPLWLKAKRLSLVEFETVKDTDSILQLSLQHLCSYLGHINLKSNEFSVFRTLMRWWEENGKHYKEESNKVILRILSCVDYQRLLLTTDINELITYPTLAGHKEITDVLECLGQMHCRMKTRRFPAECEEIAGKLLSCRSRSSAICPCILVVSKYARKDVNSIIHYDSKTNQFKKFFVVDDPKYEGLEGCKFMGYREYITMYGGEYLIGRGKWNYNLWVFDTIRDRWGIKAMLPSPRRHFESCIVGSKLFITGGTGTFRVTKENTFWYDFEKDTWSNQLKFPCFDRQLKCCCFSNRFFILSINNKCGYFLKEATPCTWDRISVEPDDSLNNLADFGLFAYDDKLYIKGKNLIEFEYNVKKKYLQVSSVKAMTNTNCDNSNCEKLEITICDDVVYTLYKLNVNFGAKKYSFEKYHMKTEQIEFIFENIDIDSIIEVDGEQFKFSPSMKLFSFNHYALVDTNELINNAFM